MKIVSGVINVVIGLFIALFAHTGLDQYFVGNKEDVAKYESLLNEGEVATAILDSTYSETTIKIKGIKAKVYEINYAFDVNDKEFKGRYFFDHPDSIASDMVNIRYLKHDPSVNAANVEKELKKKKAELNSDSDLWFGLGAAVISLLLLIVGIRKIIKGIKLLTMAKKS